MTENTTWLPTSCLRRAHVVVMPIFLQCKHLLRRDKQQNVKVIDRLISVDSGLGFLLSNSLIWIKQI